jgi:ankyrin repeat protein
VDAFSPNGWTILMRAAEFGWIRAKKTLIEKETDVNSAGKGEATALMISSERGELKFAKLLTENIR